MPDSVRLRLGRGDPLPPSTTVTPQELETALAEHRQQSQGESDQEIATESMLTERRPVLGKRARVVAPASSSPDNLERVLTSIRDVMDKSLECKRQELQLRREELEFQKEALATKLEDRRQAREEERRDRREQREADRQERLELARIENEKNLAFLKAVMESSAQQRR